MKRQILILICVAVAMLSNTHSIADEGNLWELVRSETDVDKIYNEINNAEWSDGNLAVIQALWDEDLSHYANIPRGEDDNNIIRLALANVLIQAKRHCRISEISMDDLREFVLSQVNSTNVSIRGRATYLLGLAGYDSDIPFLVSIVESEKEGYAEEAVLSITFIHSEASLKALRDLEKRVSRKSLKAFIQEALVKYGAYPLNGRSKDCSNAS